jgi:putative autoinducer-2 (AI-2) aldolase
MPDAEELKEGKEYYSDTPQRAEGFFLKGSNSLEWGMKDRLARIFNPVSGNTVMLAFDHGYLMGPTSGLERMDLTIVPLIEHADCIMCTRGALRTRCSAHDCAADRRQARLIALLVRDDCPDRIKR